MRLRLKKLLIIFIKYLYENPAQGFDFYKGIKLKYNNYSENYLKTKL